MEERPNAREVGGGCVERVRERKSIRMWGRERERERERENTHSGRERKSVWLLLLCFLLPRPALCKFGSARSALLPEVLTLVLGPFFDLPLFYFHALFPSLSFSHRHFRLLFPILPTYNFYNKQVSSK